MHHQVRGQILRTYMSLQYITALVNLSMQTMYTYYTHILDMLQYKCILNQLIPLYIISCPEWHTAWPIAVTCGV